ncbi:hypothetical protein ACHAXA_005901 [Cyclostephanos tholiformis]|uniref:Rieske domain-containing protein n=1 Tax=Cyclostephanos tholiformis TaxID=382380 RepID=A0ABD3SD71_9STRA
MTYVFIRPLALSFLLTAIGPSTRCHHRCHAFSCPIAYTSRTRATSAKSSCLEMAVGGITVVEEEEEIEGFAVDRDRGMKDATSSSPFTSATKRVGINSRGAKMNEIDFTLVPTDACLSRCYQMSEKNNGGSAATSPPPSTTTSLDREETSQNLSLTRALNTASNRAVRRILLSRSWPSAEALNLSLRMVSMQQQQQRRQGEEDVDTTGPLVQQQQQRQQHREGGEEDGERMKCPVPRPILNILMSRRGGPDTNSDAVAEPTTMNISPEERERLWIADQIAVFRDSYGALTGYDQAEAYLESVLSLATSGYESERVAEVIEGGTYVEAYGRVLSVIQSVGAVLEQVAENGDSATLSPSSSMTRRRIAKKLIDQDFCLSMLDKIALANEKMGNVMVSDAGDVNPLAVPYDATCRLAYDADPNGRSSLSFDEFKVKYEADMVAMVSAKKKLRDEGERSSSDEVVKPESKVVSKESRANGKRRWFAIWSRGKKMTDVNEEIIDESLYSVSGDDDERLPSSPAIAINPDDLGGVLLSAEEPTMTRQLNVLSNICQRALIFGGDQELLLLAETLDADKPAFIQRWYKNNTAEDSDVHAETRPGVQYLNSLIQLLRNCFTKGALIDVTPTLPLTAGYQNAYRRLTASLIELGSGYIRPSSSSSLSLFTAATEKYLKSSAPPKSAREELGRLAKWESALRKNSANPYPDDLVGTWHVQDVVGTQTIGSTEVTFKPQGELSVKPPMQGLRWRLDAGPTHLDTCTFQVLSDDGAILQYTGFVDRGSRLEARVSKRSVSMRGGISFVMRDAEGSNNYWDDVVPLNYRSGTTKFIMSRNTKGDDDESSVTDYSSTSNAGLQGALKCPPLLEGGREILYGKNGPILVTRVAGSYYAVDATCPHLNLPMKKGKVTVEEGEVVLTCSFHNSCFEMTTGKCKKWVTGALGRQNELISGIMSSVGSDKKDIKAYLVLEGEDGSLSVSETP